ncbi:hypothetical protein M8818_000697 [Zalaria obscura]|uniref:Uncharacterized protein n=1 Tax=Zalaria obscura TaxID=2024903 RepID=A0ACC3SQU6_9PEZI
MSDPSTLPALPLPEGVTESYIDCTTTCGLNFHILSSGRPDPSKTPLILCTHGYPELAYSWRHILPQLAQKGYFVVAPDQRGYGRTTGWDTRSYHEVDLSQFTLTNLVRDLVCLVYGLGYTSVACIIGHDFGAVASAMAALMRPDMFRASIQMSHPHHAPPTPTEPPKPDIQAELAKLSPPRKHYKWYNSTPTAADDWTHPPQGLHAFLRGYFHLKSADWAANTPHPLKEWSAQELSQMPDYYIMPLSSTMPSAVSDSMATEDATATTRWLPDSALAVYVSEWRRTGFQGALNWYRAQTSSSPIQKRDMLLFAGRKIEVPTAFVSGERDWGNFQQPGALEAYEDSCAEFRGATMVQGAGHWVQQEQPEKVVEAVGRFLDGL